MFVDSRGLGRWQEIVIGPKFFALPPREQGAFLLHEAGHCKLGHIRKLYWFIFRNPVRAYKFLRCLPGSKTQEVFFSRVADALPEVAAYRKLQEFQADRFAAECGYGHDLARAFSRISFDGGPFHPSQAERVLRLSKTA